jgi:DNA invertase Pin-like site-specific DNA recombinase
MIIEKPTFVKNEILKAEAEQEKIDRLALMQSMKKGNAKVALEFLNRQQEEVQQYFNDREEYRQIAQDMGLSKQEYYRCLNVLNGMSEAKASENV